MLTILLKEAVMSLFYWGDTMWNDLFKFAWGNFCKTSESQPGGWTSLVLSKYNLPLAHALFWTQQASHYFFILSSLSISSIFPWWAFPYSSFWLSMLQDRSVSQLCPKRPLGYTLGPSPNKHHWRMNCSALHLIPYPHTKMSLRNSSGQGPVLWHRVKARQRCTEEPGDFHGPLLPHRVNSVSVHPSQGRRSGQPVLWERNTFCKNDVIICDY